MLCLLGITLLDRFQRLVLRRRDAKLRVNPSVRVAFFGVARLIEIPGREPASRAGDGRDQRQQDLAASRALHFV